MFDGTPDETIDENDQLWALARLEEYIYRRHFNLTKSEMAVEPMEDMVINMKLMHLVRKKENRDNSVMEKKVRGGVR